MSYTSLAEGSSSSVLCTGAYLLTLISKFEDLVLEVPEKRYKSSRYTGNERKLIQESLDQAPLTPGSRRKLAIIPALHYPSPALSQPCIIPALHYPSPALSQPCIIPALHYPSPALSQPCIIPALHYPGPSSSLGQGKHTGTSPDASILPERPAKPEKPEGVVVQWHWLKRSIITQARLQHPSPGWGDGSDGAGVTICGYVPNIGIIHKLEQSPQPQAHSLCRLDYSSPLRRFFHIDFVHQSHHLIWPRRQGQAIGLPVAITPRGSATSISRLEERLKARSTPQFPDDALVGLKGYLLANEVGTGKNFNYFGSIELERTFLQRKKDNGEDIKAYPTLLVAPANLLAVAQTWLEGYTNFNNMNLTVHSLYNIKFLGPTSRLATHGTISHYSRQSEFDAKLKQAVNKRGQTRNKTTCFNKLISRNGKNPQDADGLLVGHSPAKWDGSKKCKVLVDSLIPSWQLRTAGAPTEEEEEYDGVELEFDADSQAGSLGLHDMWALKWWDASQPSLSLPLTDTLPTNTPMPDLLRKLVTLANDRTYKETWECMKLYAHRNEVAHADPAGHRLDLSEFLPLVVHGHRIKQEEYGTKLDSSAGGTS
ncbi:hypothetical protein B0H66DRAFT_538391 [Apodospora peruviana]|uniref:Uncharacterized protein n=1 Tax=Apodospora peruviana TaxID=516989 RepID=A0AAE0HSW9_9PEZI|nr:hypothetical protein B0H66DRAFT_538391 [Apodospora peruviana]